jgi:hypothetical protein
MTAKITEGRWLMLMHQLPARPAYTRVKIWRRLKESGSINVGNAVYVLPDGTESRSAFAALLREIESHGGDGFVVEGALLAGLRDDELRARFNAAREGDYQKLTAELRRLAQEWKKRKTPKADPVQALSRISQKLAALGRIDFFAASGRTAAEALLARLEHSHITRTAPPSPPTVDLKGKTWVTRQDIHVDRMACAWLITRFIDPGARLKFVPGRQYKPLAGEVRYDMQDGEFTHEGEDCSFEVLLRRAAIRDPALTVIGEMIHDMDLNDGKFGHPQTVGIAHVISGICRNQQSDEARVARGRELFDDIYQQFRRRKER